MTKETKVGLVIGLLFMVGVVYVLSLFTQPSGFEPQVVEYRARQRAADLQATSAKKILLSAVKKIKPSAVDTTAQKKEVVVVPKPVLKVPVVKKTVLAAAPKPQFYIVKEGQTLSDVAGEVYGWANRHEFHRIHKANEYKLPNANMIWPGLKLLIPPLAESKPTDIRKVLSLGGARTYTVMPGDTLSEISSKKLGTARRWQEILALNKDKLSSEYTPLQVGMVLKLPAASKRSGFRLPEGTDDLWR